MARILVIDDAEDIRRTLERLLVHAGHEVLLAADGAQGLRVWRERGADLVITDLHMPDKDGIETLVELRAFGPEVPVIAISGGDQTRRLDLLGDAALLGAVATLAKPFTRDELLSAVALALERPRPPATPR